MADLGHWTGGTIGTLVPTTSWASPNGLFPTETRNDGSVYSFSSTTSTLTLPSSGLADGYLIIAAFEFEDTSNGRHNPQGRLRFAGAGSNTIVSQVSGYSRDDSEDRAYVRCWAFVDSPTASGSCSFQWRRDADAPNASDGTVRSEFQVIPLYYSDVAFYSSASTSCLGGTTPNLVSGFSGTDGTNITISSNVVTLSGNNKRYLCLGSYYWEGIGNARTQRWGGFKIDSVVDESVKGYSYARNTSNADIGEMFTTMIETSTADVDVEMYIFRGLGVTNGDGGADVDGNTTGTNPAHSMVFIELHDDAEVFKNTGSTQQNVTVAGPIDIQASKVADIDFNDSSSFNRWSDTEMVFAPVVSADVLLGANVCGASFDVTSTARFTGYSEFTINGTEDSLSVSGDYARNDQGTQDTFGWSSNMMGFQSLNWKDKIGISVTELTGSEGGGSINTVAGWVNFWGINLDTLEPPPSTRRIFIT